MSKPITTDPTLSRLFIPICKIDEEQRLVYGKMTFEAQDASGEVWDYDGSKPYFEAWSANAEKTSGGKSLGNLRSMHQPIAAGKLTQFLLDDETKSCEIAAKVVDDAEWGKVLEGVYTGFSQGGRYVRRWKDPDDSSKTRYISDPVEVSLVDLPCLPGATFEYVKADGSVEVRKFNKETVMDPTNEEVAARATDIAKAAGDENKWTDHLETAREQLTAEKRGAPPAADPAGEAAPAADPAPEAPAADDAGEVGEDAEKAAAPEAASEPAGEEEEAPVDPSVNDVSAEDAEKARKAARDRLSQVWKTTDGKTFGKCEDAVSHEAALDPAAAPPPPSAVEAALKAASGEAPPEMVKFEPTPYLAVAKATLGTLCEKGLWTARRALDALECVIDLQCSAAWEAEYERDGSSVPAQLAEVCRTLGDTALAMCQEEIAEALASLPEVETAIVEIVTNADEAEFVKTVLGNEEVMKAGARNAKKDQERVQKVHDASVELGASCGEEAEKALEPDELQKRAEKDPVVKHLLDRATASEAEVTKALAGIEDLGKQITALKSTPAPMAPRTHVVGKGQDGGGGAEMSVEKAETIVAELSKTQDGQRVLAEAAIRASQSTGGQRG